MDPFISPLGATYNRFSLRSILSPALDVLLLAPANDPLDRATIFDVAFIVSLLSPRVGASFSSRFDSDTREKYG